MDAILAPDLEWMRRHVHHFEGNLNDAPGLLREARPMTRSIFVTGVANDPERRFLGAVATNAS
jgi:hypothetical protein